MTGRRSRWWRQRHNYQIKRYYRRLQKRRRNRRLDQKHLQAPSVVDFTCNEPDIFDYAERQVAAWLQRRPEARDLDKRIAPARELFRQTQKPRDGLIALLSQAPSAALAQAQMDASHHGYANKQQRLYELIDFNDTIVDTILAMDDSLRPQFNLRAKHAADRICKRVGAPCFSDEQWSAIIRGLTREVSLFLAAKDRGFLVYMTDRTHDALGIDIQAMDPETQRYINIDVKTPSSFRYRMQELVREGRMNERARLVGDRQGFILEQTGRGVLRTEVIVLCILPDEFGNLADWRFVDPEPICLKLAQLIREYGLHDDKFGSNFGQKQ